MPFAGVLRPFDGLHVSGEFNDLRAQRGIEHPARSNGNFRCPALLAGQVDLHAHVSRFDARDANQENAQKNQNNECAKPQGGELQEWTIPSHFERTILAPSASIKNSHGNPPTARDRQYSELSACGTTH
jgi:hypothetical protein